jgi:hexosaminidase
MLETAHTPLLLPTPRRLRLTDGTATYHEPQRLSNDCLAFTEAEAYHLTIAHDGIYWAWNDDAGERHAKSTLEQLRKQFGSTLPCVIIDDAPIFPKRGIMLDISRDRVPTMQQFYELIDTMAAWKLNHFQLYTEHTFAYQGHEVVWKDASPITPEELRALDAYCRMRGIELAANQNCFGHLSSWFKHKPYDQLAEIASDGTWDFNGLVTRTGGFSFCPGDPGAIALVDDLLGQLLPNVSGPLVNIGCDETFDVGQGRSKNEVAERGRAAVYLDFVKKVCAIVEKHDKRPQFWADIALEHPEYLKELPDNVIGLAWGYEPDADFEKWCKQLTQAGREVWVCPGTSCWRSITGRTSERRANLLRAARDGAQHGARGYLITAWGDLGHRQQWPVTLHALAEGAHRAWSGDAPFDPRASSLHAFDDASLTVGRWLDAYGDLDADLRKIAGKTAPDGSVKPLRNASALFIHQTTPLNAPLHPAIVGTAQTWREVMKKQDFLIGLMPAIAQHLAHKQLIVNELEFMANEVANTITRAILRTLPAVDPAVRRQAANIWRTTMKIYRALWLARCRPGGLDSSCRHYEAIANDLDTP